MSTTMSRIDAAGRLIIPAQTRKAMRMEGGGPVMLSLVDGELRVRSVAAAMAALQDHAAAFLSNEAASVDAFLTGRRAEAARDLSTTSADGPQMGKTVKTNGDA